MTPRDLAMDLLVFRSGATRFGLDAAQIAEVLSLQDQEVVGDPAAGTGRVYREGVEIRVVELAAEPGGGRPSRRRDAKLVLPKAAEPTAGFAIGDPEEMLRVEARQIEALPPMIRSMVEGSGMWAAAKCEGGLVILIDLVEAGEAALRRRGPAADAS